MNEKQTYDNQAIEPKVETSELMTNEQDFYLKSFAELKEKKSEIDQETKRVTDWFKTYMKELGIDTIENDLFKVSVSSSTGSIIKATNLLNELGIKLPNDIEALEIIDSLFSVNITEAKKKLGAISLNKIMTEGKTIETMRLTRK